MAKPPVVGRSIMAVALSEGARNWPFVFGFCVTIGIVAKMSMGLNPADAKKSPFINPDALRY
ncbi:unnamed protein product [Sphagnum compactum]